MTVSNELKKGALVNLFGVIGKLAAPAFLVAVTRLFGPDVFGIFITVTIVIEIIMAFLTAGFKDSALIFVSRHADKNEEQEELYAALSNSFVWAVGLSILVLGLSILLGEQILGLFYGEEFSNSLRLMYSLMIVSIPLIAFERIVLSATQGLKIMKYDAFSNGWLRPLSLLSFSFIFWLIDPTEKGLAFTFLATQTLLFAISLFIFTRELSWKKLVFALKSFKVNNELIHFAIPQNINMTLNRFITGIDILMLPFFGFSPTIVGLYGAGSLLVRETRSIKIIFSSAFAPHIVRLHKNKKFEELSLHLSNTASLIASLIIPILILIAIFKDFLLLIIHPEFSSNTNFLYYLLPIPYLYCSFGLTGNVVAMTGHSKLTLMNSIIVASSNVLINIVLIPKFGLIGAALASSIAMFILINFEIVEARIVASTRLYLPNIYKPHLAGIISLLIILSAYTFVPAFINTLTGHFVLGILVITSFTLIIGKSYLTRLMNRNSKE